MDAWAETMSDTIVTWDTITHAASTGFLVLMASLDQDRQRDTVGHGRQSEPT